MYIITDFRIVFQYSLYFLLLVFQLFSYGPSNFYSFLKNTVLLIFYSFRNIIHLSCIITKSIMIL